MELSNLESLRFFHPEIILTGTILFLVLLDLVLQNKKILGAIAVVGSLISLWATLQLYGAPEGWLFHRMIILDSFSPFLK